MSSEENTKNTEIYLGGFPPIIFINNDIKTKREFREKNEIDVKKLSKLNILNIKNILTEKK